MISITLPSESFWPHSSLNDVRAPGIQLALKPVPGWRCFYWLISMLALWQRQTNNTKHLSAFDSKCVSCKNVSFCCWQVVDVTEWKALSQHNVVASQRPTTINKHINEEIFVRHLWSSQRPCPYIAYVLFHKNHPKQSEQQCKIMLGKWTHTGGTATIQRRLT